MNEILLIISLILTYGGVVLAYAIFGVYGLVIFCVFATIVANIEVSILVDAFGITQTLGNILFASTFLLTDALSEIKGKQIAKQAIGVSIFFSIIFLIFTQMWILYTPIDIAFSASLQQVFSQTPRIIIVSLLVFVFASYLDVWLYHWWWSITTKIFHSKDRGLWIRNNGSTLISQFFNTCLFTFGAFYGVYELEVIYNIIVSSYCIFVCMALLDTIALYAIVYLAKRKIK